MIVREDVVPENYVKPKISGHSCHPPRHHCESPCFSASGTSLIAVAVFLARTPQATAFLPFVSSHCRNLHNKPICFHPTVIQQQAQTVPERLLLPALSYQDDDCRDDKLQDENSNLHNKQTEDWLRNPSSRRMFLSSTAVLGTTLGIRSNADASDMNSALMPSLPQAVPLPQVLPDTSGLGTSASSPPKTKSPSPPAPAPAVCDPTVAVLEKNIEGEKRQIYILGTAHISESSAQLAGGLVSQTKPGAVFVELDAKRVGRIQPQQQAKVSQSQPSQTTSLTQQQAIGFGHSNDAFVSTFDHQLIMSAALLLVEGFLQNPITALQNRIQSSLQELVGNSIKQLYQSLEKEGFSAGEEFVVAVRQGLAQNATIILGDQDVDVTLKRLTEALQKTDLQKLLTNPELNDSNLFEGGSDGDNGGGDGIKVNMAKGGKLDISAEQLKVYVETLKTQENVRRLMSSFKESAPLIYQAMVEERDLYMASGLNRLGSMTQAQVDEASKSAIVLSSDDSEAAPPQPDLAANMPYKAIVAVMGLAHLDGVRGFLIQQGGWKEVSKPAICRS